MQLYISISGIFLSIVLLYFNARKTTPSIYLAIFSFLISLYSINQYVIIYSKSEFWISIFYTNFTFLSYLIGPMCYWYTRSVLTDKIRLKKRDLWHLTPMVIHFIASLPYILTPYSYKIEIARSINSDLGFLGTYHATFLSDLLSNSAVYLSRPVLAILYVFWSVGLLINYKKKRGKEMIAARRYFIFKWLATYLGFQLILVSSHLMLVLKVFQSNVNILFYTSNMLQVLSFAGFTGLLVTPFFFPQILYGLPADTSSDVSLETEIEEIKSEIEVKKPIPNFEFDYMLSIVQKMTTSMQEKQLFLQPDCNLAQFAVSIDIPNHHLAYFFREIKKQSFNDYRNECRVNYAKKLIMEGKARDLTLEAIGLQSGFTNRNTFFTAFKKVEGISPSAFVAQSKV